MRSSTPAPVRPARIIRLPDPLAALGALVLVTAGCGNDELTGTNDTPGDAATNEVFFPDTGPTDAAPFDSATTPTDTVSPDAEVAQTCTVAGGFGCGCATASDCLDGLCVEGPDGSICTRTCDAICPEGMDCLLTAIGGDPRTICVPRHTRLCRPCDATSDCQSSLDPEPAACIPGPGPTDGSFCATSCATADCPDGYACQDVAVGQATARLCRPVDVQGDPVECSCRPAWAELALSTSCQLGTCPGARTCGAEGLSACTSAAPEGADCCGQASDCPAAEYGSAPVCDDAATCQGSRVDPVCDENLCEVGGTADDDSACNGLLANDCGLYRAIYCTGAQAQTPPTCPEACDADDDCDAAAYCSAGACVPDEDVGNPCSEVGQCSNDLTCVDQTCCSSDCTGTCVRCDQPDAAGTCTPIVRGVDPDDECPGLACTGFYWGYDAKVCYRRGAVTDSGVACDGEGGCQAAEDVCPTAARGPEASACHPECQVPKAGTCQGTTPGDCNDIPGGTRTCGEGACTNSVVLCTGGDYTECVPKEPTVEQCDGVDNDCDGFTDAADPDLVVVECDKTEGVCAGTMRTADLCVGGGWLACPDSYYAAVSPFYEAGREATCEGTGATRGLDNDCDGSADEDFVWTAPNGSTVQGAGATCGLGACAGGQTVCGTGNTLTCTTAGSASPETCNSADDDCDGVSDANDPSLVTVACEDQDGVCQGAQKTAVLCSLGVWQPCQAAQYSAHSASYQTVESACDGLDNDCNGGADTSLGAGPLNANQQGVCAGSRQRCEGVAGWRDYYGTDTIPTYNANETLPDGLFRDENCDGVDGNVSLAHFVSSGGSGTACTRTQPCSLVQALSSATKAHIYVQAGTYAPPGNTSYNIGRVVKLFGGYDAVWARAPRTTNVVTIQGGYWSSEAITLRILGVGTNEDPVIVADVVMNGETPATPGKSSYVVWVKTSSLILERVTVNAVNGAAGTGGNAGTSAASLSAPATATGGDPADYTTSGCNTSISGGGGGRLNECTSDPNGGYSEGGDGGHGGQMDAACQWCGLCACVIGPDTCGATGGVGGTAGFSTGASSDGGGAGGSGTCAQGNEGTGGGASHGGPGSGAGSGFGSVVSDFFAAASGGTGTIGSHGGGGGGGGGSGGCDSGSVLQNSRGAGGGGGGAGGCRARAGGTGGSGGGGSFGLFAIDSFMAVTSSTFVRATGGTGGVGGAGGTGQPGGQGGSGGAAAGSAKIGGKGGNGGQGGHAGGGGGGAGGVSYGIYWQRTTSTSGSLVQTSVTFTGGAGGGGGSGGAGAVPSVTGGTGAAGDSRNVCQRNGTSCL